MFAWFQQQEGPPDEALDDHAHEVVVEHDHGRMHVLHEPNGELDQDLRHHAYQSQQDPQKVRLLVLRRLRLVQYHYGKTNHGDKNADPLLVGDLLSDEDPSEDGGQDRRPPQDQGHQGNGDHHRRDHLRVVVHEAAESAHQNEEPVYLPFNARKRVYLEVQ